ncbi:MAG: hypothetical protein ABI600_19040 [Luteolibacter sp.]
MKKISVLALLAVMSGTAAFAGGIAPVIVEEVPVVEMKPASSVSPLLILGLLILIGVLVSRNNDDGGEGESEGEGGIG